MRILFVCMGNICRSPAAEGIFRKFVEERNLSDRIEIDSAGTIDYHRGKSADPRMMDAAHNRGYTLTSKARQIDRNDLNEFDLVVAMDRDNRTDIENLSKLGSARLQLLSDYLDEEYPVDVPDPYYGGAQGFETVLDMLEAACSAILDDLLSQDAATQ